MRVRIYTDGACSENPGPGGWAMVFNTDNACESFSGRELSTTNNRMELTAVVRCLERIAKFGSAEDIHEVYCDSAYVVNSINNKWLDRWKMNGWKTKQCDDIKNRDLWEQVDRYFQQIRTNGQAVRFIKIKGHAGNTFNELVDKLAKDESMKARALIGK